MTGRQEYDRTKDRQRTVDEYMVNNVSLGAKARSGWNREYCMINRGHGRMIRLQAQPLRSSPVSNLSIFLSLPLCCLSRLYWGERVGLEPNRTTARKLGPL
jgi:hypothetical protein